MAQSLPQAIAAAISRGATLLTPNQRAARAIRRAYDAERHASGQRLWTPAQVLPLESWLAAEWHQRLLNGAESRVLLNASQQHLLWREIILSDAEARTSPRSADSLAELAARAWTLLCLHHGRPRLREFPLATDSRAFARWSAAFERRLTRAALITPAELPTALAANSHTSPAEIALIDFDTHPPAVASLFAALESSGTQIDRIQTQIPSTTTLLPAEDDPSELLAAAHWIKQLRAADPHARIAVVVPNLADRRAQIDRAFAPILTPEALPITAAASSPAYEFSLGRPLAELPLAAAALDLLTWPLTPLPIERISALLLKPWFAASEPGSDPAIAEFDAYELRQHTVLRPELTLEATIRLVQSSRRSLSDLLHRLRSLQKAARELQIPQKPGQSEPLRQSHTAWSDTFRTLLEAAGWTRQSRSSSLFFQQHRRFDAALDELATLDFEGRQATASEALATLARILTATVFAPESNDAPIQILGPLELGGIPFDALWFLGADDLAWPPQPAASPLLPWQLQRALGLPGADRTRDDTQAQALTQRIAQSAAEVVFSYSYARQAEEGDRRPSPLLTALNLAELTCAPLEPPPDPLPFDLIPDEVTLPPLPDTPIRGGSSILKLQAACAFRAFAEKRLASSALDTRDLGFDALERGNLVHTVMQFLWTELQSQSALRLLPPADLASLLDACIDRALRHSHPETSWDDAYLAIQRRRLHNLLLPWLARELQRAPFTVRPPEQKQQFTLGPLTLDLRIDRIDDTADGLVILDYKTGAANPASWQGERPDEPQLPLYAVLAQQSGQQLAAVAFAILRAGKDLGLAGYAEDRALLGPARLGAMEAPSLAEQIDLWQEVLTALASSFAAGDTRVHPKSYPDTCERCGQRILCRLNPDLLDNYADDDPEFDPEGELIDG
jgi:ATP-dependent helicase/nuclease subunit B